MTSFLTIKPGQTEKLSIPGSHLEAAHLFDEDQIAAVNAALGAGRPLLVRGEPGIGKSQMARAVAKVLGRTYLPFVTDARSESRDLLWSFDAVARLADAQAQRGGGDGGRSLPVENYIRPGVLWWAFDWENAAKQTKDKLPVTAKRDGGKPENGSVVLIDEIDKADSDLPNGLLEALGVGSFEVRDQNKPVQISSKTPAPLIIITTNEERALPDAFIRRCMVLDMALPRLEEAVRNHMIKIGKVHFGEELSEDVLEAAARMVAEEREFAKENHWRPLPGQAEYIDLLRSVHAQADNPKARLSLLDTVGAFVLHKDPAAARHKAEHRK